ncbi:hypothetical protein ACFLZP_02670 [Patescibacteria group bacterium]
MPRERTPGTGTPETGTPETGTPERERLKAVTTRARARPRDSTITLLGPEGDELFYIRGNILSLRMLRKLGIEILNDPWQD